MESYLKNRHQFVKIRNAKSSDTPLTIGIPQGSVMGPILYLLYTPPLQHIIEPFNIMRHIYADDTQLYCRLPLQDPAETLRAVQNMNACIEKVRIWMLSNKLMINDQKTEVLLLGSKRSQDMLKNLDIKVLVGDSTISPSSSARNLGVILDPSVSMQQQVTSVPKAAYFHMRRLHSIRQYLTKDACSKAIHALVASRLDFNNALLLGCTEAQKHCLQVAQNHSARILTRTRDRRQHMTPILQELHWLPIDYRIRYKVLLFIHFAFHNVKCPMYMRAFIQFYQPLPHLRSAAEPMRLSPIHANTRTGHNSLLCKGFKLWNDLPCSLRALTSTHCFKQRLKTVLFRSFYQC